MSELELVEEYEKLILDVAYKLREYYPKVPIQDLKQDGIIKMLEIYDSYDPERGEFSTFLYKSLYHEMINQLKEKYSLISTPKYAKQVLTQEEINRRLAPGTIENLDILDKDCTNNFSLYESLNRKLTNRQFKICVDVILEGFTIKEESERLDISTRTISRELKAIKNKLAYDFELYKSLKN